jgi:hypothetical protein
MADEGSCEAQTAFDLSAQRLGSKGWPHHASKILGQTLDSSRLTRWRQITPLESRENSIRLQISSKHLFAGLFDINGLGAKKLGIVFFSDRRRTQVRLLVPKKHQTCTLSQIPFVRNYLLQRFARPLRVAGDEPL